VTTKNCRKGVVTSEVGISLSKQWGRRCEADDGQDGANPRNNPKYLLRKSTLGRITAAINSSNLAWCSIGVRECRCISRATRCPQNIRARLWHVLFLKQTVLDYIVPPRTDRGELILSRTVYIHICMSQSETSIDWRLVDRGLSNLEQAEELIGASPLDIYGAHHAQVQAHSGGAKWGPRGIMQTQYVVHAYPERPSLADRSLELSLGLWLRCR